MAPERRVATLAVWRSGAWRVFWRSDRAPERWTGPDSLVQAALAWTPVASGLEWTSLRIACGGPAWHIRLIVARVDPRVLKLSLRLDLSREKLQPAWTIDRAPADAVLAVNAGQFGTALPWGWVVFDGRQMLQPGAGPLASAFWLDAAGNAGWMHGDSSAAPPGAVLGFQSYPTLLGGDGVVPRALRASGVGVDPTHRDARLALGESGDGRLLIVMTRFDAAGEAAGFVPLGPTTPEMAAILGALGARDAVMLDGGISAQMMLRDPRRGTVLQWRGLRKVPLALIATPRERAAAPRGSSAP